MKVFCQSIPFADSEKAFSGFSPAFIDVWMLQTPKEGSDISSLYHTMSAEEQSKARRFYKRRDAEYYTVAHGTLRLILAKYLGVDPGTLRFSRSKKGKPFLEHGYQVPLEFNMSHSHGFVAIAVSGNPIGVDVEYLSRSLDYSQLLEPCFTEREIESIKQDERPLLAFFKLWTRKESLLKAVGTGLNNALNQIQCMDGEQDISIRAIADNSHWFIKSTTPQQDIVLSICHSAKNCQLRFLPFEILNNLYDED